MLAQGAPQHRRRLGHDDVDIQGPRRSNVSPGECEQLVREVRGIFGRSLDALHVFKDRTPPLTVPTLHLCGEVGLDKPAEVENHTEAVSYTHLTLPTIYSV